MKVAVDPKVLLKTLHKMDEVEQPQAQDIYTAHRKGGKDIVAACVEGGIREEAVLYAMAQIKGIEVAQLDGIELPKPLIDSIEAHVAHTYRIIPFRREGGILVVATAEPDELDMLDDLKFMLGVQQVRPALCSETQIERALEQYYHMEHRDLAIDELLQNRSETTTAQGIIADMEIYELNDLDDFAGMDAIAQADAAPVRKLLDLILLTAVKAQAADVHFEPFEDSFQVRNRIDGVLYEMLPVPRGLAPALIARIKVMSKLDIAERRLPQDGKIGVNIGGRSVDLRVSTLPTMFGESVVIRVLDRSVVSLDLDKLGIPDQELAYFRETIQKPNGIVVVTGPTGSGKTTTLYAALNEANEDSVKIITTEDPVEYEIDGLIQVPIDDEIGKTFSACLRSILRQDPDKILVGEIRDLETAKIAIESSLTGHIVFTTLHTNDAPTAVTRLLDMGLEPFLLAATLESIVAQRLVRTICTKCKAPYQPNREELMMIGIDPDKVGTQQFYYGTGCEACKNTGYKGRTAIFEIVRMTDQLRDLVLNKASSSQLRSAAQRSGMQTLRDTGVAKVYQGLTTIEEVVRETIADEN